MKWYHMGIKTRDIDASLSYYCDVLGLRIIETVEILGKKFVFVGNDSMQIELEQGNPGDTQAEAATMTGLNHFCVTVEDIYGFVKSVREKGGTVLNDPIHPRPDRLTSFMRDPDGVLIQVIQYV